MKTPRPINIPARKFKVAMVTTYVASEPLNLVKETLLMMKRVDYEHATFVLDESGSSNLKIFCGNNGVSYFSRKDRAEYQQAKPPFQRKTKAGNLNAWLDCYGDRFDFVTFFDADHQPKPEYLHRVLGYFQDPRVAFVQAPQVYKNGEESWIARGAIEQNSYFIGPIQKGFQGNDAAVVNGSHSTFRIKALQDIGGYAVHNADDVFTALKLYARKWKGVYVPEVLAYGLTPSYWGPNLLQQYRWSNSIFDLFIFRALPYLLRLKMRQIFCFMVMGLYYFLHINFFLLTILPIISVFVNLPPVNLVLFEFLSRFLVIYVLQLLILIGWGQKFLLRPKLERGVWWRSGFLEIVGSVYVFEGFMKALMRRHLLRIKFVTPKDNKGSVSQLYFFIPHILLSVASITAFIYSIYIDINLWQTKGIRIFLLMNIFILLGLTITSTRWFGRLFRRGSG